MANGSSKGSRGSPGHGRASVGFLLFCDAYTAVGGKDSLFNVFDRIFAKTFPAVHPKLYVVAEVLGGPEERKNLRLRFRDSQGNDVVPANELNGVALTAFGSGRVVVEINGLPIPKQGLFTFSLWEGESKIGERTLYVERTV
jgi:hypothetical protein